MTTDQSVFPKGPDPRELSLAELVELTRDLEAEWQRRLSTADPGVHQAFATLAQEQNP